MDRISLFVEMPPFERLREKEAWASSLRRRGTLKKIYYLGRLDSVMDFFFGGQIIDWNRDRLNSSALIATVLKELAALQEKEPTDGRGPGRASY